MCLCRCTRSIVNRRIVPASCRSVSPTSDLLLQLAGVFRQLPMCCCSLQECFANFRFAAAVCRSVSPTSDLLLQFAGVFRQLPICSCSLQECFHNPGCATGLLYKIIMRYSTGKILKSIDLKLYNCIVRSLSSLKEQNKCSLFHFFYHK